MVEHHDGGEDRGVVAVAGNEPARWHRHALRYVPAFLYVLVVYTLIKAIGIDMRTVLFRLGGYALTWVELLQLAASLVAMAELLKVSHPGENNTQEAIGMAAIWVVYLVLFVLGAASVQMGPIRLSVYSSTEFLMLIFVSGFQVIAGFIINARTLQRSITDMR